MIYGVDVSAYQSATVPTVTPSDEHKVDFVFVKVTEGLSYVNPRWVAQRDSAKAHGMVWGAYHYPHMANDPVREADYFLSQVAWKPGDIIVLDWEGYDAANQGVSKARQIAYRDAWLKHVKGKMPGYRVGMYANLDYWYRVDTTSNCGDFLWIATGGAPAGNPGITHPWTFHQYSTAGNMDHDAANFPTRAALAAWAKGGTANEEEDDMALSADDKKWISAEIAAQVRKIVFETDGFLEAPSDAADYSADPKSSHHYWSGHTHTVQQTFASRAAALAAEDILAQARANGAALTEIKAVLSGLDLTGVADAVKQKIESLRLRLDDTGQ